MLMLVNQRSRSQFQNIIRVNADLSGGEPLDDFRVLGQNSMSVKKIH